MKREPRVEFVDFGAWSGAALLAEYDASCDTVRINTRVLSRIRAGAGDARAESFIACALAHERFHRAFPRASEADAHEHVRAVTGVDPKSFELSVRRARSETP